MAIFEKSVRNRCVLTAYFILIVELSFFSLLYMANSGKVLIFSIL